MVVCRAVALKDRIVVFGGVLASTSRINNIDTLRIERKGRAAPCKAPLSVSLALVPGGPACR